MRLYLINSPVVRAENLRFKEEGVKEILKDLFLPWYNAFRFFIQNIQCSSVSNLYLIYINYSIRYLFLINRVSYTNQIKTIIQYPAKIKWIGG